VELILLTTIAAVLLMGCGNTDGALIQAAKGRNVEVAKHVITEGTDVNDIAHEGGWGNPLHCAARSGESV
jgi:hypothetical protein